MVFANHGMDFPSKLRSHFSAALVNFIELILQFRHCMCVCCSVASRLNEREIEVIAREHSSSRLKLYSGSPFSQKTSRDIIHVLRSGLNLYVIIFMSALFKQNHITIGHRTQLESACFYLNKRTFAILQQWLQRLGPTRWFRRMFDVVANIIVRRINQPRDPYSIYGLRHFHGKLQKLYYCFDCEIRPLDGNRTLIGPSMVSLMVTEPLIWNSASSVWTNSIVEKSIRNWPASNPSHTSAGLSISNFSPVHWRRENYLRMYFLLLSYRK